MRLLIILGLLWCVPAEAVQYTVSGVASSPPAVQVAQNTAFLVGRTPTGEWADREDQVAVSGRAGWKFIVLSAKDEVFDSSNGHLYLFTGRGQLGCGHFFGSKLVKLTDPKCRDIAGHLQTGSTYFVSERDHGSRLVLSVDGARVIYLSQPFSDETAGIWGIRLLIEKDVLPFDVQLVAIDGAKIWTPSGDEVEQVTLPAGKRYLLELIGPVASGSAWALK